MHCGSRIQIRLSAKMAGYDNKFQKTASNTSLTQYGQWRDLRATPGQTNRKRKVYSTFHKTTR
jgi:hypothetical protein